MKTFPPLVFAVCMFAYDGLFAQAGESPVAAPFNNSIPSCEIIRDVRVLAQTSPEPGIWLAIDTLKGFLGQLEKDKTYLWETACANHHLGALYSYLGEYAPAVLYTSRALDIRLKIIANEPRVAEDSAAAGFSAYNLGNFYFKKNDFYLSKKNHLLAAKILQNAEPDEASGAFREAGNAYERIGDYHEAIYCFQQAKQLAVEPLIKAQANNAMSVTLNFMGEFEKALACLNEALPLIPAQDSDELFVCYQNLGNTCEFQGQYAIEKYAEAIQYYYKAQGYTNDPDRLWTIHNAFGTAYRKNGQLDSAELSLDKAMKLAEELKSIERKSTVLDNYGEIYLARGDAAKALQYFRAAKDNLLNGQTLQSLDASTINKVVLFICLYDEGRTLSQLSGKESLALQTFADADEVLTAIRREQDSESSKLQWREKVNDMYALAIEVCNRSGNAEKAYYFMERSKAVILSDALAELSANKTIGPYFDSLQQSLKGKLLSAKSKYDRTHNPNDLHRINQVRDSLIWLAKEIAEKYPAYAETRYATEPVPLAELKQQLNDTTCFVEYFYNRNTQFALAVSKTEGPFLIKLKDNLLERRVDSLNSYFQKLEKFDDNNSYRSYPGIALRIYKGALAQALNALRLNYKKAIIVPDGPIARIPFDALVTKSSPTDKNDLSSAHFLIHKIQTQLAWSATTLWRFQSKLGYGEKPIAQLAFFSPNTYPGTRLKPLGGSSTTLIKNIELTFGNKAVHSYKDSLANGVNLLKEGSKFAAIHLHSHAVASASTVPRIYLHRDTVWMQDFYRYRFTTDVFVLGACQTSLGQQYAGEGIYSLSRALASAGVPSVISSLWEVPTNATADIFSNFYKNLKQGMSKADALHEAKKEYLEANKGREASLPNYWAAWTFAGRDNTLSIEP